jgi:hypothetical protein
MWTNTEMPNINAAAIIILSEPSCGKYIRSASCYYLVPLPRPLFIVCFSVFTIFKKTAGKEARKREKRKEHLLLLFKPKLE